MLWTSTEHDRYLEITHHDITLSGHLFTLITCGLSEQWRTTTNCIRGIGQPPVTSPLTFPKLIGMFLLAGVLRLFFWARPLTQVSITKNVPAKKAFMILCGAEKCTCGIAVDRMWYIEQPDEAGDDVIQLPNVCFTYKSSLLLSPPPLHIDTNTNATIIFRPQSLCSFQSTSLLYWRLANRKSGMLPPPSGLEWYFMLTSSVTESWKFLNFWGKLRTRCNSHKTQRTPSPYSKSTDTDTDVAAHGGGVRRIGLIGSSWTQKQQLHYFHVKTNIQEVYATSFQTLCTQSFDHKIRILQIFSSIFSLARLYP